MSAKDDHEPRWNIVNKIFNKIDKTIDTAFADNKCSFLEIEITMLMVKEKLSQQKHEMYSLYLKHKDEEKVEEKSKEEKVEDNDTVKDIYK
jgi:uncharacterized membrane protein YdbT with pleckstrin-like domain